MIGMDFNYSAPAELFMPKRKGIGRLANRPTWIGGSAGRHGASRRADY